MKVRVEYSKEALGDLRSFDLEISRRITKKVLFYIETGNPLMYAKKLQPPFDGLYRFRIGDYRVIFKIGQSGAVQVVFVVTIANRKDIYE